ncbi:TipAS antibiotic-recognition domain-containing protein [Planococcus shenhongbingii]|uniref:TipAS antibiotic-recognition domain-containing protein n=1 Tax=Planococcus shenhongbingii TaxID=3058398 RepID=A0ABT8NB22_9BACL|nr:MULTISPECIES: TipAS antibiotic-recognition domain-containing protein [unclassified Planococcus (in: firmicutes)]MDN7244867.1 TipAS antibiotic-recognition domain-containing protein [Planococcus sp. N017]WKA57984.1 TipAS antibiotic-recognition domain-containing protein [Planococcus sp. N016]
MYKVQEVAKIAGVSVRTLHHYDSVGLLKPSNIGSNRYRYYNDEDLKLLQHILFFKELGFSLKKIQEIVAEGFDSKFALVQHIELLGKKKRRIEKLIENAERTRLEIEDGEELSDEDRFAAFSIKKSDDDIKKYKAAVSEEPKSSAEQADLSEHSLAPDLKPAEDTASVEEMVPAEETNPAEESEAAPQLDLIEETVVHEEPKQEKEKENLEEINREGNRIYKAVASLMNHSPASPNVQVEMKAYYNLLDRFYDCTPKMFRSLADLYASDSRFANNIDQHGKGLSTYLKEAMYIYAAAHQNA